ncbi:hypothetical protein EJV47_00520 [Hymenobacter gummosus]|uniref:Uncharacterized protein n=1 Tax=Hymenobacter gummosus TaxID=1776032 RepID=A0A431U7Q5_9BACT|nr:hypothetical protein [Hymenobacter gummosus]RTQ53259.1 hypothetical protein EJV47_00520 [Hymenobacter gummosus]
MMQPVTIQQPAPCHESWEAMTPTDLGRHCAACQTLVVDFTQMTDAEVVAFLRHTIPGNRCGRFREDQVGRPMLAAAQPVTGLRRWAVAGVLLLGSVFGLKARAQSATPETNEQGMLPAALQPTPFTISDSLFLVQGVVRNWWGVRQAGAQVKVGWIRKTTDAKGYFSAHIPYTSRGNIQYITAWGKPPRIHMTLRAKVPFDSARTKPYRIKLRRVADYSVGFY